MANENKEPRRESAAAQPATPQATSTGGKKTRKAKKSQIGGTAVQGAKSTLPRQTSGSNNPQQQQYESYNRTMRRRMEQMGTGPSSENDRMLKEREKRKERIERRKQRLADERAKLKAAAPVGGIKLGRSTLFFALGTLAIIAILIVLFIIIRHPF